MGKLRSILSVFFLLLLMFISSVSPISAQENTGSEWTGTCVGGTINGEEAGVATIQGFECLMANILSVSITIIGLAGFCMFIYGSFKWMLSSGDAQGVTAARNSMQYAVIGIVISLSALILMNLISAFTGVNVSTFVIPSSDTNY